MVLIVHICTWPHVSPFMVFILEFASSVHSGLMASEELWSTELYLGLQEVSLMTSRNQNNVVQQNNNVQLQAMLGLLAHENELIYICRWFEAVCSQIQMLILCRLKYNFSPSIPAYQYLYRLYSTEDPTTVFTHI